MIKGIFLTEEDLRKIRMDFQGIFWDLKKVKEYSNIPEEEVKLLDEALAKIDEYYKCFGK